jgi:hypothetical protein
MAAAEAAAMDSDDEDRGDRGGGIRGGRGGGGGVSGRGGFFDGYVRDGDAYAADGTPTPHDDDRDRDEHEYKPERDTSLFDAHDLRSLAGGSDANTGMSSPSLRVSGSKPSTLNPQQSIIKF